MKKKLIILVLSIFVLAILATTLVACNRATTQGQLSDFLIDHKEEVFVYDVTNGLTNTNGTYTVSIKKYPAGSTIHDYFREALVNVPKGMLVTGHLVMGTTEYTTACYFNIVDGTSLMTPASSSRVQKENGEEVFRMQGTYYGANFSYERVINGISNSGTIKLSGTYFDNNEFHQSLRTVQTFSTNFSFSFAVPLVSQTEISAVTLNASCSALENVETAYTATLDQSAVSCYRISLSRSTKVAGLSQTLYYAVDPMKASNSALTMKNVLVKFVEPITSDGETYYVVYTLKNATILSD
ncbi:MAG: hypothetical protein IK048_04695 [Clostridia bacterium]|nr:hypothetical protein [Clostridia bacterium]